MATRPELDLMEIAAAIQRPWNAAIDGILEAARHCARWNPHLKGKKRKELLQVLGWSNSKLSRIATIGGDQRLYDEDIRKLLPVSWPTLYEFTKLSDDQLAAAIQKANEGTRNLTELKDMVARSRRSNVLPDLDASEMSTAEGQTSAAPHPGRIRSDLVEESEATKGDDLEPSGSAESAVIAELQANQGSSASGTASNPTSDEDDDLEYYRRLVERSAKEAEPPSSALLTAPIGGKVALEPIAILRAPTVPAAAYFDRLRSLSAEFGVEVQTVASLEEVAQLAGREAVEMTRFAQKLQSRVVRNFERRHAGTS